MRREEILFEAIREYAPPEVEVLSADAHINDPAFAETLVTTLLQRLHAFKEAKPVSLPGQESI